MKNYKKIITTLLVTALTGLTLTGCQKAASEQPAQAETKEASVEETSGKETSADDVVEDATVETSAEVKKIIALTGGAPEPFIWTNEDGSLDGYDIQIFNAVLAELPQYEFEYEISSDIFTSADAGYGQVIVQHLGSNDERREKYIYSYPYYFAEHGLLVKEGSDIRDWDDLAGHSTEVNSGSFNAILFEKWNEANPDKQIELIYTDDVNSTPLHVSDGTVDFEFFDYISLVEQTKNQGITGIEVIRVENDTIPNRNTGFTYFVFPKDQAEFAEAFDAKLYELIENGKLAEIATQYLGEASFAPTPEDAKNNH